MKDCLDRALAVVPTQMIAPDTVAIFLRAIEQFAIEVEKAVQRTGTTPRGTLALLLRKHTLFFKQLLDVNVQLSVPDGCNNIAFVQIMLQHCRRAKPEDTA